MALPNLVFSVASEYDGKGLGKARKDINSFDKTVKNLGRTLGVTLSAAAVVQFGKQSVKAFIADEKAAASLTRTLGNLGLAFEDKRVKAYVSQLESSSGVLDSQLRPAMQALLTTTGSVTKSQELLGLALDVSAGSGESLVTAANDVAQAFVGNTKGLKKYNLGLTQTELQTSTFVQLQEKLTAQFGGQNAAQLDTYAGKVSLLKVAYDNMQESIGKGLVTSFEMLAGDNGIGGATDAMAKFGDQISYALIGATDLLTKLNGINAKKDKVITLGGKEFKPVPSALEQLSGYGKEVTGANKQYGGIYATQYIAQQFKAEEKARALAEEAARKRAADLLKIEKDRLNNLKKIAAEAAKKLALDKASAFLNQANKLFDLERIQLAAAAMNKQTEEDRVRIRLKTEIMDLEEAIAEGNVQGAAKFASMISEDARLLGVLRGNAFALSDVPNPFDAWMASLQSALAALLAIANYVPTVTSAAMPQGPSSTFYTPQAMASQAANAEHFASLFNYDNSRTASSNGMLFPRLAEGGIVNSATMAMIGEAGPEAVIPLKQLGAFGGDTYNIYATGIGDQALAQVIQNTLQELNRYGNSTTYAGAL
jgi:hypothetical protein